MDDITRGTIWRMMHELYLYRRSSVEIGKATAEEFDACVAEIAQQEMTEIDSMGGAELAADMITTMLLRGVK